MAALALLLGCTSAAAETPLRLGIFPCCSHVHAALANIDAVNDAIQSRGVRLALLGDFIGIDAIVLPAPSLSLEATWALGAVPFVNLMPREPLRYLWAPITTDQWDDYWRLWQWAAMIRAWGQRGEGRFMYLALAPEANGEWVSYHDTGPNVAEAYRMVRYLFYLAGALPYTKLVFAPDAGAHRFEDYYPGHGVVDAVAFSSFTSCTGDMESYDQIVGPVIQRMRVLAPGVPILLAQTGACGGTAALREAWATALFTRLASEPGVLGAMWFNRNDSGGEFALSPASWSRAVAPLDPRVRP